MKVWFDVDITEWGLPLEFYTCTTGFSFRFLCFGINFNKSNTKPLFIILDELGRVA
jgi:hypothetical protein